VGRRAGLDGCGKSCPHRYSIPGPSWPQWVAIPTALSRPILCLQTGCKAQSCNCCVAVHFFREIHGASVLYPWFDKISVLNKTGVRTEKYYKSVNIKNFLNGKTAPSGPGRPHYRGFTIVLRRTTLGTIRLDGWSTRRRDICLTTQNTRDRHIHAPRRNSNPQVKSLVKWKV